MQKQKTKHKLLPRLKLKKKKAKKYIIVDFRDEYIHLPSGQSIPRQKIIHIDTSNKKILYLDDRGQLREASYDLG